MGWAYGRNLEGREVGYGVSAICDLEGCNESIDRGLGYVCGGMHDGGDYGCGRYFCSGHLFFLWWEIPGGGAFCDECANGLETEFDPDEDGSIDA